MRKKTLIVGLGNEVVPEDSAALQFVRRLTSSDADIIEGGTDLLRVADQLADREMIVLVDVVDDPEIEIAVLDHGSPTLDDAQMHAHHLSAVQALDLIRFSNESVRSARCVWVLLGPEYARNEP